MGKESKLYIYQDHRIVIVTILWNCGRRTLVNPIHPKLTDWFAIQIGITHLGETGPLSQGVQARKKALIIRYINGMDVRKKRPRGFKKRPRGFK